VIVVASLGQSAEGKLVYFMSIENARFRKPVEPGDQLRFDGSSLLHSIDTGAPWKRVSRAMDQICNRYGDEAIRFGSMLKLEDEAPDRIGFRKTVGVDVAQED
jgi:acyl dehydratase